MIEHDGFDDQHDAVSDTAPTDTADITAPLDLEDHGLTDPGGADQLITDPGPMDDSDAGGTLQVIDADGTSVDIGPPTLSSGAGQLDSVVNYSEHGAEVFTDTDGDGEVDQIVRVGLDGGVTAWNLDDAGAWQLTTSGHVDADGGLDLRPQYPDTDSAGPNDPSGPPDSSPAADGAAGPEISVPGADGTSYTGTASYDADGDGVPETVVVHSDDGSLTTASDLDGDGVADQLVVLAPDGAVTVSAADGSGGWTVVATGVQNPDGSVSITESNEPPASEPAASEPAASDPAASDPAASEPSGSDPAASEPSSGAPASTSAPASSSVEPAGPADTPDPAEPAAESSSPAAAPDEPADGADGEVPSGHLAVADGDTYTDAGVPQYDLNGDGIPETTVEVRDGVMYQYSDTDGDGRADQLLQVNTDDRSAQILIDAGDGGGWQVEVTGNVDADGDFVPDEPQGVGGQGSVPDAAPDDGHDEPASDGALPAITVTMPDGEPLELGAPDQDIDGDGVAESVAVRTGDGHVLIVTDADADGVAEQVVDVDPDSGQVRWLTIDADGSWAVAQHGHLSTDGELVVDGEGDVVAEGLQGPDVSVSVDGRTFPAGPASIDSDGDGVPDTVVVPGLGGSNQYYQDADGDGIADRAWTVNSDGTVGTVYAIDDSGQWVPLDDATAAGAGSQSQEEPAAAEAADAGTESPKGWFG